MDHSMEGRLLVSLGGLVFFKHTHIIYIYIYMCVYIYTYIYIYVCVCLCVCMYSAYWAEEDFVYYSRVTLRFDSQ